MQKLNSELYNYYTQPENFSSVAEIFTDFPFVRKKLIDDFWAEVSELLQNKVNSDEWYLGIDNAFEDDYIDIGISPYSSFKKGDNPFVWVSYMDYYRRPYLNIYFEEDFKFKVDEVLSLFESYKSLGWTFKHTEKSDKPALWKYVELNFSVTKSLEHILPENRVFMTERYADEFIASAISLKPLIEAIVANKL